MCPANPGHLYRMRAIHVDISLAEAVLCEVRTLAHYKRGETMSSGGSIISANKRFTCYAISGGLIRVIHRETDASLLLRGLQHPVADMCLCDDEDVLASVSISSCVFVCRLAVSGSNIR